MYQELSSLINAFSLISTGETEETEETDRYL